MPKAITHISLLLLASTISIVVSSCGTSKTIECNSIAKVLEKVQVATKEMDASKTTDPAKAATVFSDMSGKIEGFGKDIQALEIKDEKLKGYQSRIAEMYRGYGKLFGEMAPAIKSKNTPKVTKDIAELKAASVKEQALGKEIGAYCGGN
jgi:predicted small secreted protein